MLVKKKGEAPAADAVSLWRSSAGLSVTLSGEEVVVVVVIVSLVVDAAPASMEPAAAAACAVSSSVIERLVNEFF